MTSTTSSSDSQRSLQRARDFTSSSWWRRIVEASVSWVGHFGGSTRNMSRTSSSSPERRNPLRYEKGEKPPFAFCESVHATGSSPWHIRRVTETGLHLGGAIDTPSLCGRVKPPSEGSNGWDLEVRISEAHLEHACPKCVEEYRKLCKHCGESPT